MRAVIALAVLLASHVVCAADASSPATISLYRHSLEPTQIDLSTQPIESISSKTPHRLLNPNHKTFQFEGISVVQLLSLTNRDSKQVVYFIGSDGYTAMIPAAVLLKTDAILALKKDGHSLSESDGGIQVVFPTEGPNAVDTKYAAKAAFWCWYVRSIIIGDLPKSKELKDSSNLANVPFSFEPRSVFQFEKQHCPASVRVPLSQVEQSPEVRIRQLSGKEKKVESSRFDLLLSADGAALPIRCGGPYGLVERARVANLKSPVLAQDLELGVVKVEALQ
jgi:hypothetical protein